MQGAVYRVGAFDDLTHQKNQTDEALIGVAHTLKCPAKYARH